MVENFMKIIESSANDFEAEFTALLGRGKMDIANVTGIVGGIIGEIQNEGNAALKRHISQFDKWEVKSDDHLKIDTA